jgi:hypothetical protein
VYAAPEGLSFDNATYPALKRWAILSRSRNAGLGLAIRNLFANTRGEHLDARMSTEADELLMTHSIITGVLAVFTLASAVTAAVLWFKSACVKPNVSEYPPASSDDNPQLLILTTQVNLDVLENAAKSAAHWNKWAAIWTGISALLSAATTIGGICRL